MQDKDDARYIGSLVVYLIFDQVHGNSSKLRFLLKDGCV